ncbi:MULTISPECIES: proline/glycine betaine ABC transporter permease [Raoultella]|uniref:ABC transporter permease n=1 Tax=Raoultella TaxID=160674 RepID=UPI0009773FD7|nr:MULTISPECIES: ABC transporter permease subunit [Raoultella]MCS4270600.1 glycine betaine/proline transport system permease protein [Raoultella sp. BIGb0132]MCS4287560.1 glycine betaine/proline transport system permease protein [Raoultella terrigena]OMP96525.1 hypothetical protein BZP36_01550 [Raoultella terrigena]
MMQQPDVVTPFYQRAFSQLQDESRRLPPFHRKAALFGSLWLGAHRFRGLFWLFLSAELIGAALIVLALSHGLSRDQQARVTTLVELASQRAQEAAAAHKQDPQSAMTQSLERSAASLSKAASDARAALEAERGGRGLILGGLAALLGARVILGFAAVPLMAGRLRRARLTEDFSGMTCSTGAALFAALIWLAIVPMALLNYAGAIPAQIFNPAGLPELASNASRWIDEGMGALAAALAPAAQHISRVIDALLGALEYALIATPWPVVFIVLLAFAAQRGGWRLAFGVGVGLAYILAFGYWTKAMQTVALLGTASFIAVAVGIPLGIWSGYRRRVASVIRPVLDFMQTTPAFVYLIPIIALFGIGKTAGIIATIIFGIAPVIRQTAFGIANVPPTVREAALAFGAGRGFMLFKVDLPIARPAILAGVSQTVLMSLSMVVIAALIGAKGLGEDVLSALQYAAQGKGILAGLAILICAIVIDRMVQFRRRS